jgi:hypothetical protein
MTMKKTARRKRTGVSIGKGAAADEKRAARSSGRPPFVALVGGS